MTSICARPSVPPHRGPGDQTPSVQAVSRVVRLAALLVPAAGLLGGCDREVPDGPYARAVQIEGLDEVIGGPMSAARPGDFLLENDKARFAILGGRNSAGPGLYGGSLVDADLNWQDANLNGGNGRDQFNEMFPLVSMNVPLADQPEHVTVVSDGSDGEAIVRVTGTGAPFLSLLDLLWGLVGMPDMWTTTDYIVRPGEPWVDIRTTVTFQETPEPVVDGIPVTYPTADLDVIAAGLTDGIAMGDFFLAGGNLDVFAPGIGFDEDGAVYRGFLENRNSFTNPYQFPFVAGVADGISYGLVPSQGDAFIPLFTASQTAIVSGIRARTNPGLPRFNPEEAFTYERTFVVGHGDVGSILDHYITLRDIPHGRLEGVVLEQGTAEPMPAMDVFAYEVGAPYPWAQWRTDVRPDDTVHDGSFGGNLPVGDWELLVHRQGRPDSARLPITITEGETTSVLLESPRPGSVQFDIRDETGQRVPAKLTIFQERPSHETSNRQPALGDPYIAGSPEWVVFAEYGEGEVLLPPGNYYAVASRGLEYELDVSPVFEVTGNSAHQIEFMVRRALESDGWISADFHVHSAPSHDSGVTLPTRVRTMVTEGVEFFTSNDHDVYTDFQPIIEEMRLSPWVRSAVGVETTTVEIGHFLGFPMRVHWLEDAGGAMNWTGLTPSEIITNLRAEGARDGFDPMVFVAHPRDGILGYFDQFGFDTFSGAPGAPEWSPSLLGAANPLLDPGNATLDFDGLELFTSKRIDLHRTPTKPELDGFNVGDGTDVYDWITRTMQEQQDLSDGVYRLNADVEGGVDDWFTTLNLGYRITALGNSDTHGTTSTEAGCPRNYVLTGIDDPQFLEAQAVADAVKEHRVVASYGPFLRMWIDGADIGSEIEADGAIEIEIEVQAPTWVDVDRVELYENGTLIREFVVEPGGPAVLRFRETVTHTPDRDSWYVAIATGDQTLAPVFTEVEIPYLPLEEVVSEALGVIDIVGSLLGEPLLFPKEYPVLPYALTNPIWVNVDGGEWTPPGIPSWMIPAAEQSGQSMTISNRHGAASCTHGGH